MGQHSSSTFGSSSGNNPQSQKQYYMNDWPNDMLPMRRWFLGMQLKVHRFPFARVTETLPHIYYKFMTSTPD